MKQLIRKWWPKAPDRELWSARLARFYDESEAYHAMTAAGKRLDHAHVQLLLSIIQPGHRYAEIGCGGGTVSRAVAERASICGYDISAIAVERARKLCEGLPAELEVASAEELPLADNAVDGAFSFEVLEHVWDPVAVLAEMARVVKPGGFIFVSTPNQLSLDLHIHKRPLVRRVERLFGYARLLYDRLRGTRYVNYAPDIEREDVYPDCDMISSLVPCNLPDVMASLGCRIDFLDLYYLTAHDSRHPLDLAYQRHAGERIGRWFGDHILLMAKVR